MITKKIQDNINKIKNIGRIFEDRDSGITWFNWTCSGVEFEFTGSCLLAQFHACSSLETDGVPGDSNAPTRVLWPWVAVFVDDSTEPVHLIELNREKVTGLIYASDLPETHKIKIIKISENAKGKAGISAFHMDGEINGLIQEEKQLFIEFIGDSITCGFGNATGERDRFFYSNEENGWMSHAAIAARLLNADYNMVCVSGITVGRGMDKDIWPLIPMLDVYPYTDRLFEEMAGKKDHWIKWDFHNNVPDIIVINLGTNDSSLIALEGDNANGELNFKKNYYDFLKELRKLNGSKPYILCTLGSMDYYLYDCLQEVAESYAEDFKDDRIGCMKYGRIRWTEGLGACGHPTIATQQRMGEELASFVKSLHKNNIIRPDTK